MRYIPLCCHLSGPAAAYDPKHVEEEEVVCLYLERKGSPAPGRQLWPARYWSHVFIARTLQFIRQLVKGDFADV